MNWSSGALVATMMAVDASERRRRAPPAATARRTAPRGQIAAAIAAHDAGVAGGAVRDPALDRGEQDLCGQPALREHDGGDLLAQKAQGDLRRLAEVGRADAELRIDDRRVVADERL